MDAKSLTLLLNKIKELILNKKLSSAISQLSGILSLYQGLWKLKDKIERIDSDYSYLKQFALDGIKDPVRVKVYSSISERLLMVTDQLRRSIIKSQSNALYYNTLRYEEQQNEVSISQLLNDYKKYHEMKDSLLSVEMIEERIFKRIWVNFPMSADNEKLLYESMQDSQLGNSIKHVIIYGIFLSLLEFYDDRKLELLAKIYTSDNQKEIRVISLICLLIVLWMNRDREILLSPEIIKKLKMSQGFDEDVRCISMAMLKAGDTERITKKMNEDIIPALTKLKPEIEKRMKELKDLDPDNDLSDFNPDWENLFSDAGLSDKIKELTELQSQGNDLMMVTFSQLKSFPFFSEIVNWFIPFNINHSTLKKGNHHHEIFQMLAESKLFCESDKYSMALSLSGVPESQLEMVTNQIKIQSKEFDELLSTNLNQEKINRDLIVTKTIQNVYRFFKLFRRKGEFKDPFKNFIILSELDFLKDILGDDLSKRRIADFLFTRGYYSVAKDIYHSVINNGINESELYQKAAYCYQSTGNIEEALKLYEISDLIDSNNIWNLKRLGFCSRIMGKTKDALNYYLRILELKPDDISATINAGYCQMDIKNFEEAIKLFYKVDFLDHISGKALRPLAWCFLVTGNYEKAEKYYNLLSNKGLNAEDNLNIGHLYMIKGDYRNAVNKYSEAYSTDPEKFYKDMLKDKEVLLNAGVDPFMYDIVIDSLN